MLINSELLKKYQATEIRYDKNQTIFWEGDIASYYYQIRTGIVKTFTYNDAGSELVMGFFTDTDSFGEPPLFGCFPYPSSAISMTKSILYKIDLGNFTNLIRENFAYHLEFDKVLSQRVLYKSFLLKDIMHETANNRILKIIDYFRDKSLGCDESKLPETEYFTFPFTRSQLASIVGLRVETVIRHISKLNKEGEIIIKDRKILRKYKSL